MPRQIKQDIVIRAVDNTTRGFRSVEKNMTRMERFMRRVQTTLLGFVGINIAVNLVRDIVAISDVAVELDAKLALVTQTTEELTKAQAELTKVSLESGSSLEANTILFTRMARPVRALGFELEDTLRITKLVAQGLRISGASQQESASVIRQLSQAFQSGVLRGEEFNALMENGGRIAIALADGLGVTTGELRKMSKAGELSTESVIKALKKQSAAIERENAKLPLTIGRALENIRTKFLNFSRQNKEVNRAIADSINNIATNIDTILKVAAIGLTVLFGKVTQAIVASQIARYKAAVEARKEAIAEHNRAVRKSALTAARLKETIAVTAAEVQLRRVENDRLASSIILNQAELKNATTKKAKLALNTAIAAQQKSLIAGEALLVKATNAHTAALVKNVAAQKAVGSANVLTSLTGMSNIFSKMTGFVSRLGSALLGLPGLILLAVVTIAGMYIEWGVAWEALLTGLRKIIAFTKLAFANLTKPWNIVENVANFKKDLEKADEQFTKFVDKHLADQAAQTAGYKDAADQRAKVRQQELQDENRRQSAIRKSTKEIAELRKEDAEREIEAQEQLSEHADAVLEARQAVIDSELEMERDRIASLQLGTEDYADAITQIEAEASDKHTELLLASINADEARWNDFYNQREENAIAHADSELQIETDAIDERLAKELASFENEAKGRNDHSEYIKKLEKDAAKDRGDVIADALLARGEQFRASRLEELLKQREFNVKKADALRDSLGKLRDLRKGYLDDVATHEQNVRDLERRSADFFRELNADTTTDAGKAASAQAKLLATQKELRRIDTLDQVEDAKQINDIRKNALGDLESIASAEKSRGESLKQGSIASMEANNNQRQAAELYKDVIKETIDFEKASAKVKTESARVLEEDIKRRVESLKTYEKAIEENDKLIAVQRQIVIDVESDAALKAIDVIQVKLDKLKNKKIIVTTVHKTITERAGGGFGGEDVRLNTGGYPRRKDRVPGSGSGDKIKALLEPQEFIVKKSSSKILGSGILNLANQNPQALVDMVDSPVKRAFGGYADSSSRDEKEQKRLLRQIDYYKRQEAEARDAHKRLPSRMAGGGLQGRGGRESSLLFASKMAAGRLNLLVGLGSKTVAKGRNLVEEHFGLSTKSDFGTAGYLRTFKAKEQNNKKWTALLKENEVGMVAAEKGFTVDYSGSVTNSLATTNASGDVTRGREELTKSTPVSQVQNSVSSAMSDANKTVSKAILPAVSNASNSGSIVKSQLSQPKVNATSPSGLQNSEKIEVLLKTDDGNSATGVFDSDNATRQLLDSLRNNGQVTG